MARALSVRKGDQVKVRKGRDAGKSGRVLSVNAAKMTCTVEHVNMLKRHTRPQPQRNIKGGIVEREGPIALGNVAVICPACAKPVRVAHQFLEDGSKVRACRKCGGTLDQ